MTPPTVLTHPAARRAERLDRRLALYAQYASLVGDEVAAAWSADPLRVGLLTRALAHERADLAERYEALRAERDGPAADGAFDVVFSEAVTELAHASAVEGALRARLDALHGGRLGQGVAGLLGAGVSGATGGATRQPEEEAPADAAGDPGHGDRSARVVSTVLGGALVAARSEGIGGALAGRYPGAAAGADLAVYASDAAAGMAARAAAGAAAGAAGEERPRVRRMDFTF